MQRRIQLWNIEEEQTLKPEVTEQLTQIIEILVNMED